jgi:hypothetical protein
MPASNPLDNEGLHCTWLMSFSSSDASPAQQQHIQGTGTRTRREGGWAGGGGLHRRRATRGVGEALATATGSPTYTGQQC